MSCDRIESLREKLVGSAREYADTQILDRKQEVKRYLETDTESYDARVTAFLAGVAQCLLWLSGGEPKASVINDIDQALERAARDFGKTKNWLRQPPKTSKMGERLKCESCMDQIVVDPHYRGYDPVPWDISDDYIPEPVRALAAADGHKLRAKPYIIRIDPTCDRPNFYDYPKQAICWKCWPKLGPKEHVEGYILYDRIRMTAAEKQKAGTK